MGPDIVEYLERIDACRSAVELCRSRRGEPRSILQVVKLSAATLLSALLSYAAFGAFLHANSDLCGADPDAFRCTDPLETASYWAFWAFLLAFGALALVCIYRLVRWAKRQRRFR